MARQVKTEKPPGSEDAPKGEEKRHGDPQGVPDSPDRERVASELDLKARNVEEQLEQLTDLVRSLTERISAEEDAKELLKIQLDEAYAHLANARRDAPPETSFQRAFLEQPLQEELGSQGLKAVRAAEELQFLLEQERQRNNEMRMQYERQLKQMRGGVERQKRDLKQTLLQQVEFIIVKYRKLATEAVELAKQERKKTQAERVKARELAERACKIFERDLKDKTKKALEEYRSLAREAHKAAKAEREELQAKCSELESNLKRDCQQFEAQVVREAEKRVQCYRLSQQATRDELERERRRFSALMSEVSERVERECRDYEAAVVKALVVFCKSKGIDVDEENLQKQMAAIRQQQIKAQAATAPENTNKALTVRYGFQAVAP